MICKDCGEDKPLDAFTLERTGRRRTNCKPCRSRRTRERYHANPGPWKERAKWHRRMARFGLTRPDYEALLLSQSGRCAICGTSPDRDLDVDHDHSCCDNTERTCGNCVRGLLCMNCNRGLGQFKDDPTRLLRAYEYLTKERAS